MIGLDTNVLVRYLTQDDPAQSRDATNCIERRCTVDDPGWINLIVLCEMVWVLTGAYGYSRNEIADLLAKLLSVAELLIEAHETVVAALQIYRRSKIDFANALIGIHNRHAGCRLTATFDRKALVVAGFGSVSEHH